MNGKPMQDIKPMKINEIIQDETCNFHLVRWLFKNSLWSGFDRIRIFENFIKDKNLDVDIFDDTTRIIDCLEQAADVLGEISHKILKAYEKDLESKQNKEKA